MATPEVVVTVVGILCEAFSRKPTEATYMAYEMGLEGVSDEDMRNAAAACLRESKFMPSPSELRERAQPGVTIEDAAVLAFQSVADAVSTVGSYRHVDFSDPVINATVRALGGWPEICARPQREFDVFVRKDFVTTYATYCRSGVSEEASRPLPGLSQSGEVTMHDGRKLTYEAETKRIDVETPRTKGRIAATSRAGIERRRADIPRIELKKA